MYKTSYWWENEITTSSYGSFLPHEADIVIIGAGIAGLSTAYWLLANKKKTSIIILDNSPFSGFKGSGRELGMAILTGGKGYVDLVDRVGEQAARTYVRVNRKNNQLLHRFVNKNNIPCSYERSGGLRLSGCVNEQEDLIESAKLLNDAGILCTVLTEQEIISILPSNKVHGGLYIPCESTLNPLAFVTFVANRLRDLTNVKFCFSAGVKEIEKSKRNAYRIVKMDNGHEIKARHVIHTSEELHDLDWLIPFREHAIASDKLPDNLCETFPHMPLVVNNGYDYYRLQDQSLLSSGSRFAAGSSGEAMIRNDASYNPKVYESLSTNIARMFPISNIVGHTHAWTFISHETPDGLPVIGKLNDDDQQFIISGLGSHRFGMGLIAGRIVAEQMYNSTKGIAILGKIFSPSRFN
jgi:glycine/D-amino acid oxidase-like deaminating enzyme